MMPGCYKEGEPDFIYSIILARGNLKTGCEETQRKWAQRISKITGSRNVSIQVGVRPIQCVSTPSLWDQNVFLALWELTS